MRTTEDEVGDNKKDPLNNLFDEPISILFPSSDTSSRASSIELTILPPNPTIEQLQVALKAKKPTCTGIVSNYSCGNHDTTPDYGGTIVPTNTGDDIAMNSHVITVISIDGEGNGSGLIKIPMMNNIKLGITLNGIKVAEGGCIVAGKAELSGISASVLNDELHTKLEKAYAGYKQIINVGVSNADVIAKNINNVIETINNLTAKIGEKKRTTKALLETYTLDEEETLLKNCTDINTDSRILQDSLEAMICKMKTGKLKGNIDKLEKASEANITFMNKLEPALAQCQNKTSWENWEQKPCKGPCDFEVYYSIFDCKSELRNVFGVKEESIKNYHFSIDIATEKWLDGEGKTFYKTYIDCDVKETKEWTRFDVNLNSIAQGQIYPFEVNSNLPNQRSYEASKKELPMAGEWGNSIFSIASGKIDDYIFLGRVLNFCPNVIKEIKQPWLRPFNGAIATVKTADFAEKTKTITEWVYAIVDGYYICKSIGAAAWRLSKGIHGAESLLNKSLIVELKAAGVKFTEVDLKWVFKNSDGKILFLEKGNINAGFEHILNHKNDFIAKGITEKDISDFIMTALKENKIVGYQGTGTGRPIYELIYKGTKQRVAITTGGNGFVVGANPTSF